MKPTRRFLGAPLALLFAACALGAPIKAAAQAGAPGAAVAGGGPAAASAPAAPELPLFAVEIRTGPKWDAAKPPPEQAWFREHSAHLRRLREAGQIRFGARYGDKGLIVLAAATIEEARSWMDADPSMQHGTFAYELHPMAVFYGGTLTPMRRR